MKHVTVKLTGSPVLESPLMDNPLHVIIGGLAVIGIFMIGGYLNMRKRPKDERAEFWGYSHLMIRTAGIIFLVWALAAFVYQIFRDIFK
jgi:hypothetical protein